MKLIRMLERLPGRLLCWSGRHRWQGHFYGRDSKNGLEGHKVYVASIAEIFRYWRTHPEYAGGFTMRCDRCLYLERYVWHLKEE